MKHVVFVISFVLAFLLFAVQPMATKMVLPTLGGTPAVWNTAMFTFQCLLLAGYAYAHALAAYVAPRWQWRLHALVVAASGALLPLSVTLATSDAMLARPIPYLVMAFVLQLGLPFFALAATQPLLQRWVSRAEHPLAATPYVLYSASNLGSFAGLLGYILLAEPLLGLQAQSIGWSGLYVLGMGALLLVAYQLSKHAVVPLTHEKKLRGAASGAGWRTCVFWIFLAFLPSSLSLGVTTYIATDIASVPLLWVVPLALYLLSFVDAFRAKPLLVGLCTRIAPLLGMVALILYGMQAHRFAYGFPLHLGAFAVLAFALHGWLARAKPDASKLTIFYLCLSFGGALGGVLNGLVAPMLLREALEYPLVLLVASATSFILLQQATGAGWVRRQLLVASHIILQVLGMTAGIYVVLKFLDGADFTALDSSTLMMATNFAAMLSLLMQRRFVQAYYACVAVALVMLLAMSTGVLGYWTLFKDRNFFGVERVYFRPEATLNYLMHDTTMHGLQSLAPGESTRPLSYYASLGELFERLPVMQAHPMAVVGLGIGTMKCYAAEQQRVDFYEINPMVKMLAEDTRYFQQLRDCPGSYDVLLGDGRVRLAQQPDAQYGVLVLDAFSSDAIPAHLLTREALELYMRKLVPHGVLLIHTTNRHLDLWPLLGAHAAGLGLEAYGRHFTTRDAVVSSSFWVVMARTPDDLDALVGDDEAWKRIPDEGDRPWTDQYINLLPYFKVLR